MENVIRNIGKATIYTSKSFGETVSFAVKAVLKIFSKNVYNSATISVLINQIYYTAVEIIPLFIFVSVILGSLVLGILFATLKDVGLDQYLGNILVGFAVTELSPFVTVLLLALRSSSAINTEIAVMKVNRELDTLKAFHIDIVDYLLVPRILSGMISLLLLSGLFSTVLITSGFLFSKVIFGMGLNTYFNTIAKSVHLYDVVILFLKCLTFGLFITLIPIRSGMRLMYDLTRIPVAVLHGMIRVFVAIIVIEVLSLLARFI